MAVRKQITWILVIGDTKIKLHVHDGKQPGLQLMLVEEVLKRLAQDQAKAKAKKKSSGGWWPFGKKEKGKKPKLKLAETPEEMMRDMAMVMNRAAKRGYYDTVVIVGASYNLEKITSRLKPAAQERLHGELTKDMTNASEYELQKYMSNVIRL